MKKTGSLICATLAALAILAGCSRRAQAPAAKDAPPPAPLGLPAVEYPADNPYTAAKAELGMLLYFDPRLSKDGTVSCATCHDPQHAWAEDKPTSDGIAGQKGPVNSPTVLNTAYLKVLFWDGRAKSLEEQALGPIENPKEMGHSMENLIADLEKIPEYVRRFRDVFGTGVTKEGVAKAIATYERTVLSGDSPYDRYKAGDESALRDAQKRGLAVFDANCAVCHAPPIFSNSQFFNAGIGMDKPEPDQGRKAVTGLEADLGKFRVPALREIAKTGPYFHDGATKTLAEAVDLMAAGGKDNPNLSAILKGVREANLTAENRADLVAFLEALSGTYPIPEPPKLP